MATTDEQKRVKAERAKARANTPEGKAKAREWQKKWRSSEKGKAAMKAYRKSAHGRKIFQAATARYMAKLENQAKRHAYVRREDIKERQRAYHRAYYRANGVKHKKRMEAWRRAGIPMPTREMPDNCECCGTHFSDLTNRLCLDHDHTKNTFRGWICQPCNTGIGVLGDKVANLERAVAYLKANEST